MNVNANTFQAISDEISRHNGETFTLDTLEDLLAGYSVDYDAYDLKAVRAGIGHPTNEGSFMFVYEWTGDGTDGGAAMADLFASNRLSVIYVVNCGEYRRVGDTLRPCGDTRNIGRYESITDARNAYDRTDPRREWRTSISDPANGVYVEFYEEQTTADGQAYCSTRIAEKTYQLEG